MSVTTTIKQVLTDNCVREDPPLLALQRTLSNTGILDRLITPHKKLRCRDMLPPASSSNLGVRRSFSPSCWIAAPWGVTQISKVFPNYATKFGTCFYMLNMKILKYDSLGRTN